MWQRRLVDPFVWTPAIIPGCILYAGAYEEARATRATQPVLLDGACEDVSRWEAYSGALLSNQPGGVSGNCMRVAYNGAENPIAGQSIGIVGNRYRASGWFRGDGAKPPEVLVFNSLALGLASNEWQSFAADQTMGASGIFGLRCTTTAAGYAEFDSITLSNLSLASYTPLYTTIPGSVLAQATATAQPWVSSDGLGIRYQGGDLLQWSAAKSNYRCLHDGTGGTLIFAVRPSVINASNWAAASCVVDTSTIGVGLTYNNANIAILYVCNGSGTAYALAANASTTIAVGNTYVFTVRTAAGANGVTVRKNGTGIITGTLASPSASDSSSALSFGAYHAGSASSVDGIVGHPFVANRVLTDAECTAVENYILAQATL